MATINRGILGGFRGKVANVVGSGWKGIATMRSLPISVANPRTVGQVNQRTKFSALVAIMHYLLVPIIQPLWNRFAIGKSGFNAWLSANIPNVSDVGVLDYPNFVISQGQLLSAAISDVNASVGSNVAEIVWVDNTGAGNALATDLGYATFYNATDDKWGIPTLIQDRQYELTEVTQEGVFGAGKTLHCYLSFRRADGTMVSNTSYYTIVT